MARCSLCKCDATGEKFGFRVCDYHQTHGEDDPSCPTCQHPPTRPVYEEDGSGAHVSWCPCYSCEVGRKPIVNHVAAFHGQQAARRLRWIAEADYTNSLNRDLFRHWQREAVRYAMAAAHAAQGQA